MPVLNFSDFQYVLEEVQKTTPALKFKDSAGKLFYLPVVQGSCPESLKLKTSDGTTYRLDVKTLVYEENTLNTCQTVSLKPGCYFVELKGGKGGFCQNRYATVAQNSSGGGGGGYYYSDYSDGYNAAVNETYTEVFYICGAGGGGATAGKAGNGSGGGLYVGEAGTAGSMSAGGNGGSFSRVGVSSKSGGKGGQTVTFSCAGQTLYSYGGGGGGAINTKALFPQTAEGGAGGQGSSGTSESSYIRIYKVG